VTKNVTSDKERKSVLSCSEAITVVRHSSYDEHIGQVRQWYEEEHQNWFAVDGQASKWKLWNTVLDLAKDSVDKIQNYLNSNIAGTKHSAKHCCYKQLMALMLWVCSEPD